MSLNSAFLHINRHEILPRGIPLSGIPRGNIPVRKEKEYQIFASVLINLQL